MSSRRQLLDYHRPQSLKSGSETVINKETRRCIRNLANYNVPKQLKRRGPRSRSAAVLVALFIGRLGEIYVLLNQRSSTMRTYAGDTSLPGGRAEPGDRNIEDTARREAFEEIGLSMDKEKAPFLCKLEPFLSGNQLLVTPVVVLLLDETFRPVLNRAEVASLFSHPLRALLSTESSFPQDTHTDEVPYYTYTDEPWYHSDRNRPIREHRFLTGREAGGIKPICGLTAAILIRVAEIGFARSPDFEVFAPGQPSMTERIDFALCQDPKFIEAAEEDELNEKSSYRGIVNEFLKRAPRLQIRRRRVRTRL